MEGEVDAEEGWCFELGLGLAPATPESLASSLSALNTTHANIKATTTATDTQHHRSTPPYHRRSNSHPIAIPIPILEASPDDEPPCMQST